MSRRVGKESSGADSIISIREEIALWVVCRTVLEENLLDFQVQEGKQRRKRKEGRKKTRRDQVRKGVAKRVTLEHKRGQRHPSSRSQ